MNTDIVALDLFAGTGWGVACKRLGIEERGVELMKEAVETRTANGMETVYRDVWEGLLLSNEMHELLYGAYNLLIASPPCQTFSMAGNGAGRKALNEVIEAIQLHAYKDPAELLKFGEQHDMRTALVLTPLAYVYRDRPQYVAFEQVPTVLPVWEECAKIMREWGYSVKTQTLQAEQYGVPQTRKRAILVARLDGPVALPIPTHSKYYPTNPSKLDPGVHKWVSMAEALGWGMTHRPYLTVTGGGDKDSKDNKHVGDPAPSALGSAASRGRVTSEREAGRFIYPDAPDRQLMTPGGELKLLAEELATLQSYPQSFTQNNKLSNQAVRNLDQPAPTVTAGHDYNNRGFLQEDGSFTVATPDEVAALQSYPSGRGLTDRPSPTITGGGTETGGAEPIAKYHERYTSAPGWEGSTERLSTEEAAALQTYPVFRNGNQANAAVRSVDQPAPTLHFGQRSNKVEWLDAELAKDPSASGERVTTDQAARIQTFPGEPAFTWCGSRSKIFLQIGNAVPPLLAQRILEALTQDNDLI
jgi:DNA (cytosine-5)-methyltransferase 1